MAPSVTAISDLPIQVAAQPLHARSALLDPSGTTPTTTTVADSPNPSNPGDVVAITATVAGAGGTPTGNVLFEDNGSPLGTAALNGVAGNDQATFYTEYLPSGNHTLEAIYQGDSTFAGSNGSTLQTVTGNAQAILIVGLPFTDTVTITNPDGSIDTTYTGTEHFTSSDIAPGVVLPPDYTFLPSDRGVHTFVNAVTLQTLGYQTLTVTDTVNPTITNTLTVFMVANLDAVTQFAVSAPANADPGIPFNVTVTAENYIGSPVTDYSGTIHIASSDPLAQLPQDYTFQPGDGGTHTFSVTLQTPGNQTITTADTFSGVSSQTSVAVNTVNSPPTLVNPGNQTTPEGGTVSLLFSAIDLDGDKLSYSFNGVPAGLSIDRNTGQISGTITAPPAFYISSVTVDDGHGNSATQGFGWTVTAGNASQLAFLQQPTNTIAGQNISPTVTVEVEDAFGNQVFSDNSTVTLALNNGTLNGTVSAVAVNGIAIFPNLSINQVGSNFILQAGDANLTGANSNPFAVFPAPATHLLVTAVPTTVMAGASFNLTVTPVDPFGNVATSYAGTVYFTSTDTAPGVVIPPDFTFHPGNPNGQIFLGSVLQTPGTQTIRVADIANFAINGMVNITVIAPTPPPVANDNSYGVHENLPVNVPAWLGVLSVDIFDPSQPATSQLVTGPAHGSLTLNADGSFTYTPDRNFHGADRFTYQVLQVGLTSNVATVTLDVHGSNHPPVAQDDSYTVITGQNLNAAAEQGVLADDFDIDGDPITAQLVSSPRDGTLQFNSDGSFTYTPFVGFIGTDSFTYRAFDGLALSKPATVKIDVQHAVSLFPPDDQANNEGDAVNLQFPATDANNLPIAYSAAGLPAGLAIDPATGFITGTVPYNAAQINNGKYLITITAGDGQDSVTGTFTWFITDTNRLTQPDDQVNEPGDPVALQLQATAGTFTFAAIGLPLGLTINSTTGLISGTITENPAHPRTHTVTVSITDGNGTTDSQQFKWTVQNNQPYVDIAINDTEATDDDYSINLQPITARVTLHDPVPGEHQIQIVVPSGRSTITNGTFFLIDGQSAEIGINPQQYSQIKDDVVLLAQLDGNQAGQAKSTNGKITLGLVDATDTPPAMRSAMQYRIPPREKDITVVPVTIDKTLEGKKLQTWVEGNGGGNGRALIDTSGSAKNPTLLDGTVNIKVNNMNIKIAGSATEQTDPGHAKMLTLHVGIKGTKDEATSNPFSVAAIPVNFSDEFLKEITQGPTRGIEVKDSWESDSGVPADLNKVMISEQVQVTDSGAALKGKKLDSSGYQPAYIMPPLFSKDSHGLPLALTKKEGFIIASQVCIFKDERTGAKDIPMANSGYELLYLVFLDKDGKLKLLVQKEGKKTTANGYESDAGATVPARLIQKKIPL